MSASGLPTTAIQPSPAPSSSNVKTSHTSPSSSRSPTSKHFQHHHPNQSSPRRHPHSNYQVGRKSSSSPSQASGSSNPLNSGTDSSRSMTGIGPPSSTYDPNASYATAAAQDPALDYAAFMASYEHPQHSHSQQHAQHPSYGLSIAAGMDYSNSLGGNIDMGVSTSAGQNMYSGAGGNPMFYQVQQQQTYDALPTPTQSQHGYHHNQQHAVPTSQFDFELPRQHGYQTALPQHQHTSFTDLDYANAHSHGTTSITATVASSTPRTSNTPTVSSGTPPVAYDYQQQPQEYYQLPQAPPQNSYVHQQTPQQQPNQVNAPHWQHQPSTAGPSVQKRDVQHSNTVPPATDAVSPIGGLPASSVAASSKGERITGSRAGKGATTGNAGGASATPSRTQKSQSVQKSRKRARPTPAEESGSEDDDDEDGIFSGQTGSGGMSSSWMLNMPSIPGLRFGVESTGGGSRLPGACKHCKKLKMKCEFPLNENVCKRCRAGGHPCIVEGRKPRSAPNKREYLLAQIRQKDAIIESLLKQLHNPYMATPLSIAAYRMASSPSDTAGNRNVIQWLERLQQSVHNEPTTTPGARAAFKIDKSGRGHRSKRDGDDDSDSEAEVSVRVQRVDDSGYGGDNSTNVTESPPKGLLDGEYNHAVSETLGQNDALPDDPIKMIARLALENPRRRSRSKSRMSGSGTANARGSREGSATDDILDENENDNDIGPANETYFLKGPASNLEVRKALIERHSPPEILVHGLVNAEDVERLFEIFYDKVNPFLSLLDPILHTPASTFARCPFLFTVVCAIASRYYREKAEIYAIAMHFAKHAASTALIDGWKSVELCQAYILMAVYAVPARRWEEDRSWLYTGLAIRLATDLNLHQPSTVKPTSEEHEREMLNRTRVWMICFNLDRSTATQFGKPVTIREDFIIRTGTEWYKHSKLNHPFDVHLCGYSSLLRIVAGFHDEIFSDRDSPSGLNETADFRSITLRHNERLGTFHEEWSRRFKEDSDPENPGARFRCLLLPFLVNYSRLVMFSFGFQQAFRRGFQQGDSLFLTKCMEAAQAVVKCVIDSLAPSGYFKYSPDGHFVFASFASAFLLKLLRPEFASLVTGEQASSILQLIGKLIQVLASSDVAIDDRHTPKLYARFLAGLLAKHQPGGPSSGRLHPRQPPEGQTTERDQTTGYGQMYTGGDGQSTFQVVDGSQGSSTQSGTTQRPIGGGEGPSTMQVFQYPSPQSMQSASPMESTPIYEPEATYAVGAGPLELSSDASAFGVGGLVYGISEDETLATMQALKSPAWWQAMLMPGFSWPENQEQAAANYQAAMDLGHNYTPQTMSMPG